MALKTMRPYERDLALAGRATASYGDAVALVERLPHILHWALGSLAMFIAMALENPAGFAKFGWVEVSLFIGVAGLVFSVVSRLIMVLCPWPYAWMAHRLGSP